MASLSQCLEKSHPLIGPLWFFKEEILVFDFLTWKPIHHLLSIPPPPFPPVPECLGQGRSDSTLLCMPGLGNS